MVRDKKQVGRPAKTDSIGNIIESKTINVNVPVKLVEFLKDQKVNRSELFTNVVTDMYNGKICPRCYSKGEIGPVGIQCVTCSNNYSKQTGGEIRTFWLKFHHCLNPDCDKMYSYDNLFASYNDPDDVALGLDNPVKGCKSCLFENCLE
jgi:hypothetical protein